MATWFVIAIYVALMTLPAGQKQFTLIQPGAKKTLVFTQQTNGAWACASQGKVAFGVMVDGAEVKIAAGDDLRSFDMTGMLDLPATVDWTKIEKLPLKGEGTGGPLLIRRDGNLIVLSQEQPGILKKPVEIQWEKQP